MTRLHHKRLNPKGLALAPKIARLEGGQSNNMKTITKKQGEVRTRDWLIATGQAIVVAVAQVLLDVIPSVGLNFDWELIATTAVIVFLNHVVRKASESDRVITVEEK